MIHEQKTASFCSLRSVHAHLTLDYRAYARASSSWSFWLDVSSKSLLLSRLHPLPHLTSIHPAYAKPTSQVCECVEARLAVSKRIRLSENFY
jgi:hypothetical protein